VWAESTVASGIGIFIMKRENCVKKEMYKALPLLSLHPMGKNYKWSIMSIEEEWERTNWAALRAENK
jgi:hypothetical protein